MRVFFNDLSTGNPDMSLLDNFDKVHRFSELISQLNKTIGISLITSSEKFQALQLCDTSISECIYKPEHHDHINVIKQLINYFSKDKNLDNDIVFSHIATGRKSILLGNAHEHSLPAISLTFEDHFANPVIYGEVNDRETSIINLYDKDQKYRPLNFVSVRDCRPYDPRVTPLWNLDATNAYHKHVYNELESITLQPHNKIAILEKHSIFIAELNGWTIDERLTKLNRTDKKFRRIFRASKFSKGKGYLSTDFEKSDVYFELFDVSGKHLGEYRWDGTLNKGPDKTGKHNIST